MRDVVYSEPLWSGPVVQTMLNVIYMIYSEPIASPSKTGYVFHLSSPASLLVPVFKYDAPFPC